MFRIVGYDKVTDELVDVAVADNSTERDIILRQEANNYYELRAVHLRILSWPHRGGGWRARLDLSTNGGA